MPSAIVGKPRLFARSMTERTILALPALVCIDSTNERSILILSKSKLPKIVQAGIARAEVVERYLDADVLEGDEGGPGCIEIGDERRLGDFDLKALRRKLGFGQDGKHLHRQQRIAEMQRRYVERDRDLRRPVPRVKAGAAERRVGEFADETELLDDRDEDLRLDISPDGVAPTRQNLEADEPIFGQLHQRLIVRLDVMRRDRPSDILLQGNAGPQSASPCFA